MTRKPHLMRAKHHPLLDMGNVEHERRMQKWMLRCMLLMVFILMAVVMGVVLTRD